MTRRPSRGMRLAIAAAVLLIFMPAGAAAAQQRRAEIVLATTTSTQDTGLLDSLLPMFRRASGITVKPIAVGTGAALEMARRGDADAVLVHAPEAEREYVQSGDLIGGRRIMHNDFLLIGPASDPARVREQPDAVAAMRVPRRCPSARRRGRAWGHAPRRRRATDVHLDGPRDVPCLQRPDLSCSAQ